MLSMLDKSIQMFEDMKNGTRVEPIDLKNGLISVNTYVNSIPQKCYTFDYKNMMCQMINIHNESDLLCQTMNIRRIRTSHDEYFWGIEYEQLDEKTSLTLDNLYFNYLNQPKYINHNEYENIHIEVSEGFLHRLSKHIIARDLLILRGGFLTR
eukprot:UN25193